MTVFVERPGLQTTIQAGPRTGQRHLGVPAAGAADPLSLALANRLVGNTALAPGLEATFTGPALRFESQAFVAISGADTRVTLNGRECKAHRVLQVHPGDRLEFGAARTGARNYLAIAGGFTATAILGSVSTYLPAGIGGIAGRALVMGDRLRVGDPVPVRRDARTPESYCPPMTHAWALRVCRGAEFDLLDVPSARRLLETSWTVSRRADRMGLELAGPALRVSSQGRMPSAAVFPGTLQCPESGVPFLLGVDAQTTGGYPRLLQVARCDRHLLGQLRPGDRVRFLDREPAAAAADLRDKHAYWRRWLPDIADVI